VVSIARTDQVERPSGLKKIIAPGGGYCVNRTKLHPGPQAHPRKRVTEIREFGKIEIAKSGSGNPEWEMRE
jgi:hypothetical protein